MLFRPAVTRALALVRFRAVPAGAQTPQRQTQEDDYTPNYHSTIFRLDRVKTPLLTISGDQDPNVPANQSRELHYALRRLGKDVERVRYTNGGSTFHASS